MHLSPPVAFASVRSKIVVLLLLIRCWLLLPLWDSVIILCFVVRYFVSILVLKSSWWGRESWLLCFVCLPGVSRLLCGSSSRCQGLNCGISWSYSLFLLKFTTPAPLVLVFANIAHYATSALIWLMCERVWCHLVQKYLSYFKLYTIIWKLFCHEYAIYFISWSEKMYIS